VKQKELIALTEEEIVAVGAMLNLYMWTSEAVRNTPRAGFLLDLTDKFRRKQEAIAFRRAQLNGYPRGGRPASTRES